jgi:hypothetical protein
MGAPAKRCVYYPTILVRTMSFIMIRRMHVPELNWCHSRIGVFVCLLVSVYEGLCFWRTALWSSLKQFCWLYVVFGTFYMRVVRNSLNERYSGDCVYPSIYICRKLSNGLILNLVWVIGAESYPSFYCWSLLFPFYNYSHYDQIEVQVNWNSSPCLDEAHYIKRHIRTETICDQTREIIC